MFLGARTKQSCFSDNYEAYRDCEEQDKSLLTVFLSLCVEAGVMGAKLEKEIFLKCIVREKLQVVNPQRPDYPLLGRHGQCRPPSLAPS